MTQSTEQERAEFTDGAWYWVEKEGWHDEPPKIAPAMYRADCDAWYSWEFSGISTEYLKVMEPCVRHEQAARRAPAAPVPQGWKLVPSESTEEMARAFRADDAPHYFVMTTMRCNDFAERYRAAISAAPQPPEAASMISSREIVSKPGSGVTVTRLNLSDVGRAALQSKANHIEDAAPQPPETEKCATCQNLEAGGVSIKQCTVAEPVQLPLTDAQVFDLSNGTLPGKGHQLIHESDPGYAAMCDTDPGARWILSNVYPENSLAFARAIERAHGITQEKQG